MSAPYRVRRIVSREKNEPSNSMSRTSFYEATAQRNRIASLRWLSLSLLTLLQVHVRSSLVSFVHVLRWPPADKATLCSAQPYSNTCFTGAWCWYAIFLLVSSSDERRISKLDRSIKKHRPTRGVGDGAHPRFDLVRNLELGKPGEAAPMYSCTTWQGWRGNATLALCKREDVHNQCVSEQI